MKLLRNSGNERVIDRLRDWLQPDAAVDFMSPVFSLYAFAEMHDHLSKIGHCRILLGSDSAITNSLYGGPADIAARRSEEHTSELQSLMRISYAVFCLKQKTNNHLQQH